MCEVNIVIEERTDEFLPSETCCEEPGALMGKGILIATILTAIFACAARAQDSTSPQSNPAQDNGAKIEEIVVTATRRAESVEKVPISVSALSQQDLVQADVKGIADIAAMTPGLQFQLPNGYAATINTVSIRGMNAAVGASVVGIYLDDVPLQSRLPAVGNVGVVFPYSFDMNRVEVERGPQGTLFGAGSEAGAVRFVSNAPSLTEFSGFTHAEIATTEGGTPSAEIGAAAGGPIIQDVLGFRVSAWDRHDGGYINHEDLLTGEVTPNANKNDKLAFRAALALKVGDGFLITPSFYFQQTRVGDASRFYGPLSDVSDQKFVDGALLPEHVGDDLKIASIKAEDHLPFADLTVMASYMNRSVVQSSDLSTVYGPFTDLAGFGSPIGPWYPTSPADVTPLTSVQGINGFTEEVRLASNHPDAFVTWVAGLFNDHRTQIDEQFLSSEFIQPSGGNFYYISQQVTDDQIAVFGQVDFHLTQQLTATLGERVAQVRTHEVDYSGSGLYNVGAPPVAYTAIKQTPNTPKAGLSFQADSNNLFYVSWAKGFRVGGGNAPLPTTCDQTVPPYESDSDTSYEIGAKNQFFDRRLQIDTSVFRVNWRNIQQLVVATCGVAYTANSGNAVSKGFDVALQGVVTDKLRINIDFGYVDARYTDNVDANNGTPLVQAGDTIGLTPQVNSPWDVNASANYDIPLSSNDKLWVRGEYQYHSRNPGPFATLIPGSPNYEPLITPDPPTHLVNARLGYTRDKLDVTLFCNNLFNSLPLLGAFQLPATSDLVTYNTFRPRTIGLSVNYGF
jgi:iron complex outermembrane recepter protein